MGRQFQIYLLPSDAERLVDVLRREIGIRLLASRSPGSEPVEAPSPILTEAGITRVDCVIAPELSVPVQIRTNHIEKQGYWIVNTLFSDVIEFGDCHFDGKTLHRGRFFYDLGFYNEAEQWQKKSQRFLAWAERLFKTTKKSLKRIPSLDAYVGADAERWRSSGGVFVNLALKGRPPIVAK